MCTGVDGLCSDPLMSSTGKHGDVVAPFGGASQPNAGDISAVVATFKQISFGRSLTHADLVGQAEDIAPNQSVNFVDIRTVVKAFQSYPSARPEPTV